MIEINSKEIIDNLINKIMSQQNISAEDLGIRDEELRSNWYDMALLKELPDSCTKKKGATSSNQSSILLTGDDYSMFPVIRRKEFNGKTIGRHITIKLPFKIMSNNLRRLKGEVIEENVVINTIVTTNEASQNRVELGTKTVDGEEYKEFYDSLYGGCKLLVLKVANKIEYIMLAISDDDSKLYLDGVSLSKAITYFDNKARITNGSQVTFVGVDNLVIEPSNVERLQQFAHNRIVFGAPGTGKSYILNKDKDLFGDNYERVTFHSNYTYSNFVGTYKPIPSIDKKGAEVITYEYVPGPFMRVLAKALSSEEPFLLLVEEINRANVAAVFGEMFQLLDREGGESLYEIETSEDVRKYLAKELKRNIAEFNRIKIPSNMYIWATMNSADQGVFPMDTAFKRRWDFEYINIDKNEGSMNNVKFRINEREVNWNDLRKEINRKLLLECKVNEDKLLGPYFISKSNLECDENGLVRNNNNFIRVFKNKVIMYIFEDAAGRQHRNKFFKNFEKYGTYSKICEAFDLIGEEVFGITLSQNDGDDDN